MMCSSFKSIFVLPICNNVNIWNFFTECVPLDIRLSYIKCETPCSHHAGTQELCTTHGQEGYDRGHLQ